MGSAKLSLDNEHLEYAIKVYSHSRENVKPAPKWLC